jgi:hypothetical protein
VIAFSRTESSGNSFEMSFLAQMPTAVSVYLYEKTGVVPVLVKQLQKVSKKYLLPEYIIEIFYDQGCKNALV